MKNKQNGRENKRKGYQNIGKIDRILIDIQKQLRKSDIAARFGGEEFIVLLPETSLEKAKKITDRLKKAIHSDKIFQKHKLTVSGGVTQFREKADSKKKIKQRVDKALYQAKEGGRDRFVAVK